MFILAMAKALNSEVSVYTSNPYELTAGVSGCSECCVSDCFFPLLDALMSGCLISLID